MNHLAGFDVNTSQAVNAEAENASTLNNSIVTSTAAGNRFTEASEGASRAAFGTDSAANSRLNSQAPLLTSPSRMTDSERRQLESKRLQFSVAANHIGNTNHGNHSRKRHHKTLAAYEQ